MNHYSIINYESRYFDKLNSFWQDTGLGGSHRGDTAQTIIDTVSAGGHMLLMIDNNDEIIGSSWLTNDKRRTYLHHFGIRADCRRQGLARILLEKSLELARHDGFQIKLEVHRDNEAALALYNKYGFGELGKYEVLIMRDINSIS
ncbi:MAG TPA: GNAT family N-acetyltransferase [Lentimicrobium sp.]|nr:GNAT family N-acetyltransferase [Lentimicrobium sp.]